MKHSLLGLALAGLLASVGVHAADESVVIDGKQYRTIEVNGQTYLTPDNGSKQRVARSADGKAPRQTLRSGDVLLQGVASHSSPPAAPVGGSR